FDRAADERRVEVPRFGPQPGPGRTEPVAPLRDRLVPDGDLFVPAVDQLVPFEARHQLIEGRRAALHAVGRDGLADDAPRLSAVAEQAEDEELQVRQPRDPLRRHKVTLSTITLDEAWPAAVYQGLPFLRGGRNLLSTDAMTT